MAEPNITVLVPTLEFDRFTKDAVDSVLADRSGGRVEVSLVLDGPQSTIPDWVRRAEIKLQFTGHRSGAASSLNLARLVAQSPIIARLDADDLSYPGRFGAQIYELEHGAVVVGTGAALVDEQSVEIGVIPTRRGDPRQALLHNNPFVHSSIMMKAEYFDKVGGYDASCIRMQDYDLLLRLALLGRMTILQERFVGYRLHQGQSSRVMKGFPRLMRRISAGRSALAAELAVPAAKQFARNSFFVASQAARYAGLRKPGYYRGIGPV